MSSMQRFTVTLFCVLFLVWVRPAAGASLSDKDHVDKGKAQETETDKESQIDSMFQKLQSLQAKLADAKQALDMKAHQARIAAEIEKKKSDKTSDKEAEETKVSGANNKVENQHVEGADGNQDKTKTSNKIADSAKHQKETEKFRDDDDDEDDDDDDDDDDDEDDDDEDDDKKNTKKSAVKHKNGKDSSDDDDWWDGDDKKNTKKSAVKHKNEKDSSDDDEWWDEDDKKNIKKSSIKHKNEKDSSDDDDWWDGDDKKNIKKSAVKHTNEKDSDDDDDDEEDKKKIKIASVNHKNNKDGSDDEDDDDDDDDKKKVGSAVKTTDTAAGKKTEYMKELNDAAKSVKESGKGNHVDDNQFDDWVENKLELAEQAIEEFYVLIDTLTELFSMEDDGYNKKSKDTNKHEAQADTKNGKSHANLKEKLTNKLSDVVGSVKYLENMMKSFRKMFAKK